MTGGEDTENTTVRADSSVKDYRAGAVCAAVSVAVNLFLTGLKLAAGILGNSSAMTVDAVHSASDVVSSVIVWLGMKMAAKPADRDHPWGHGKAEALAAKIVAILLIIAGLKLGYDALVSISERSFKEVKVIALWAAVISIVVKELNFHYAYRLGKRLDSLSLKADAWHHRSDAISSLIALGGITLSIYGGAKWHFMDHLAAALVAGIIIFVGVKFFQRAASDLMDKLIPEEQLRPIREAIEQTQGVRAVESLAARRSGLKVLVDVHVEVNPDITVYEGHEIARRVRQDLIAKCPDVQNALVHIEPDSGERPSNGKNS